MANTENGPAFLVASPMRLSAKRHGSTVHTFADPTRHSFRFRCAVTSPPPPTRPPARYGLSGPSSTPSPSPCVSLVGREALKQVVRRSPRTTPVIVFFHARWCRVCKTLSNKLGLVAQRFPYLQWYEVDNAVPDNKPLCHDLDVRLLPTFRIYWGGSDDTSHVEDFTTGPFGSKRLIERLDDFFERNAHKLS